MVATPQYITQLGSCEAHAGAPALEVERMVFCVKQM